MSYSVRYTCFCRLTYKESAFMMNCKISYLNFYSSAGLEVFKDENVVISVWNVVSFEVWRRSDKCDVTTTWTNEISSCKRLARNVLREHFENVENFMNVHLVFRFTYVADVSFRIIQDLLPLPLENEIKHKKHEKNIQNIFNFNII